MVMYRNGIIIQSLKDNGYKGVDGSGFSADSAENWYLNNYQDCSDFEDYYDEYINRTFFVPVEDIVSNDYDLSINKYKETVYEAVEYEATDVILGKIEELESQIQLELRELKELLK